MWTLHVHFVVVIKLFICCRFQRQRKATCTRREGKLGLHTSSFLSQDMCYQSQMLCFVMGWCATFSVVLNCPPPPPSGGRMTTPGRRGGWLSMAQSSSISSTSWTRTISVGTSSSWRRWLMSRKCQMWVASCRPLCMFVAYTCTCACLLHVCTFTCIWPCRVFLITCSSIAMLLGRMLHVAVPEDLMELLSEQAVALVLITRNIPLLQNNAMFLSTHHHVCHHGGQRTCVHIELTAWVSSTHKHTYICTLIHTHTTWHK